MAGFEVITEANSPGEPDPSTSSSSAPPVDGVLTRLGENGQYWGDLALLKRMAWAAESAKSALWCPAAASLSLSPSWPALLVNCGFPSLVCAGFRGDAVPPRRSGAARKEEAPVATC